MTSEQIEEIILDNYADNIMDLGENAVLMYWNDMCNNWRDGKDLITEDTNNNTYLKNGISYDFLEDAINRRDLVDYLAYYGAIDLTFEVENYYKEA